MIKHRQNTLIILVIAVLLSSGCARKNLLLPEDTLSTPGTAVLAWAAESPKAAMYRRGSQGLLDIAANMAVGRGLSSRLEEEEVAPLIRDQFLNRFRGNLEQKGFRVEVIDTAIDLSGAEKPDEKGDDIPPYDFRPLVKSSAKYLVFVKVKTFGAARNYYGFIPLGAPQGTASLDGYFIRLPENKVVAEQHSEANLDVVGSEWDTPPRYQALIDAGKKALADAVNEIEGNFFRSPSGG